MPILVSCSCGKQFRVKDDRAGKKGRCPDCGGTLVVPYPVLEADDDPQLGHWGLIIETASVEGPSSADDSRGLDLGIDLSAAPRRTVAEKQQEQGEPGSEAEQVEEDHLPPRVPIDRPAPAVITPAPQAVIHSANPGPRQVVLVGVEIPFNELMWLIFQIWLAMLFLSVLLGFTAGMIFVIIRGMLDPLH